MADDRLKDHQVREERPLDQLPAPSGEALNQRALLQLRRKRIVQRAGILRCDPHAQITDERHDREARDGRDDGGLGVNAEPFHAHVAPDDSTKHDEIRQVVGDRLEPRAVMRFAEAASRNLTVAAVEDGAEEIQERADDARPIAADGERDAGGDRERESCERDVIGACT